MKVVRFFNALVSRPVGRKEMLTNPDALASMKKEWSGLIDQGVFDLGAVRECDAVAKEAKAKGEEIHMARAHGICVEKHSQLPVGDPKRKFKGRGVLLGNQVKNQSFEAAMFQDLGNSPASFEASRWADFLGCHDGGMRSGCSVVLATQTAGAVSVDGYTLTLAANPWNIVRLQLDPGPRASLRLPLPARHGLQLRGVHVRGRQRLRPLYGSFVGDQGAWSTAKMYFTVPPNGVADAHFQSPGLPNQTTGTVDVYGLQILDATLETAGAHAHHARQFSGALQQPELPGCRVIAGNTGNVVCNTSFTNLSDSRVKTEMAEADVAELQQLFDSVEAKQYKRPDMNEDLRLGFASNDFAGTKWKNLTGPRTGFGSIAQTLQQAQVRDPSISREEDRLQQLRAWSP